MGPGLGHLAWPAAELSSASLGPVRARGVGVPNWPTYGKLSNVPGRSALDLTKTLQPSRAIALRAKPGALARYRSGRGLAPAPRPPPPRHSQPLPVAGFRGLRFLRLKVALRGPPARLLPSPQR